MLHYASQIALDPFIMSLKVLVHPLHADSGGARHLLVDGWQRQATFLRDVGLGLVILHDMCVDIHLAEVLILRHILRQRIQVDDHQTDITTNLWRGQADALRLEKRLPHITNQLFQLRIIGRDIL